MKQLFKSRVDFKLLFYNLKQYKALLVIYSIIMFSIGPLILIVNQFTGSGPIIMPLLDVLRYLLLSLTIFLLLVTPFVVFNYITSKKSVDVYHSLPIRRSDLFLTLSLTSLTIVLVPFLANYSLNYIFASIMNSSLMLMDYQAGFIDLIHIIPILLAISIIPIFVISNTGTLLNSFIHTSLLVVLPFLVYLTLFIFVGSYGFSIASFDSNLIYLVSPISGVVSVFTNPGSGFYNRSFIASFWLILSLIVLCVSLRIYTRRKSEYSETPFVNEWYFPLVTSIFTGLLIVFINVLAKFNEGYTLSNFLDPYSLVFAIFFSFAFYAILNFFRYRTLKSIASTIKQYLVILTIALTVSGLLIGTGFMGRIWKVPSAKEVERIEYTVSPFSNNLPLTALGDDFGPTTAYSLTSSESINEFIDFHNLINRRFKKQKDYMRNGSIEGLGDMHPAFTSEDAFYIPSFSFTYHLKDGSTLKRSIKLPAVLLIELIDILDNEDFLMNSNPILSNTLESDAINVLTKDLNKRLQTGDEDTFKKGLQEAYFKDINRLTPQDLVYKESDIAYFIQYNYKKIYAPNKYEADNSLSFDSPYFLVIDTRFPETIKYLEGFASVGTNALLDIELNSHNSYAQFGLTIAGYGRGGDGSSNPITLDPALINRMQGSHLKDTKGESLALHFANGVINVPLKP